MLELLRAEVEAIRLRRGGPQPVAAQQPVLPPQQQPPQQQQGASAHAQPAPPAARQAVPGPVPGIAPGTVVQGVPLRELPARPLGRQLGVPPSAAVAVAPALTQPAASEAPAAGGPLAVAVAQVQPRAVGHEAPLATVEHSLPPPQQQQQQRQQQQQQQQQQQHPPGLEPTAGQLPQPSAAQPPAAVIVRQQQVGAAVPSGEHLPPLSVEEQRSGDALLADILQDMSGLQAAAGAADAADGMEVRVAAEPRPVSPTLAALAGGGAEPGPAGGVAAAPAIAGAAGGGPQPEQLLQEADDILRGILGEPEALPGVTVQQVHPPRVEQQGPQQGQLDPLGLVSASAGAAARLAGTSNAQER